MRSLLRRVFVCFAAAAAVTAGAAGLNGCAAKPPLAKAETGAATAPESATASKRVSATEAKAESQAQAPAAVSTTAPAATAAGGAGGSAASAAAGPAATGSVVPVVARAQTPDERRAAIDKRLNDSLGSFDAKLRAEQQRIAQERDARQATVSTAATSDSGGPSDSSGKSPTAGQSAEAAGSATTEDPERPAGARTGSNSRRGESRSARAGDLKSDKAAGGAIGNAAGNGAVANETADGNDDDIVARRLRKAAEQETDPELKDKLWKEYVEYKKNNQGN